MTVIDCSGQYRAKGVSTAKWSRAALSFPIRANTNTEAKRIAEDAILELLPGWSTGIVLLSKNGKRVDSWQLNRN